MTLPTTFVRFEYGQEDRISPTFGPFDWVQIRYGELVVSPNGDTLAGTDGGGCWRIAEDPGTQYTDVIIWGEAEEAQHV